MAPYARARPSWEDFPSTNTLVRGQDLEKWDAAIYSLKGDIASLLPWWAMAEAYEPTGTITRNSSGVATSAAVKWPDGSAGTYTATTLDGATGAVNAYTITHTDSGLTVTQPAVTRDVTGAVTSKPAMTVA